jgi:hypothetical protein
MRKWTKMLPVSVSLTTFTLLAGIAAAMLSPIGGAASASAGMVRGTVVLGPMCPGPPRQGHECADMPIATVIDVFRSVDSPVASGKPYRRIKSDHQGNFKVALPPGSYWFVPHAPPERPGTAFAKPVNVVVGAGTTTLALAVDTGMR